MSNSNKSHLSNLINLALADGKIVEEERSLFLKIGKRMGFSEEDITKELDAEMQAEFVFPENKTERYKQLYDMLSMIMVDGNIHENEVLLIKKIARKLDFEDEIVAPLIAKIEEYLEKGYNNNQLSSNLNDLINKI
jgi:uncharacterized tellurite resistance protein B-like protein